MNIKWLKFISTLYNVGKHLKPAVRLGRAMNDLNPKLLSKCIIEQDDGILITIEVKPGARITGIEGIDEWRDCINVKLKARAEKGKANKELIQLLSSILSLPSSNIIIVGGKKSRQKSIKILGLKAEEVARRFKQKFDERCVFASTRTG